MIAEQLQAARSAHWRQQNNPLLTLEDAEQWLQQHPLCLFLPRRAQLPAPAPSFVEACLGRADATPGPEAISHAQGLLTRLTAAGTAVPLNLLGTAGEQPDFLATTVALPFLISLRAEPDWKRAPQTSSGRRVSPLVVELWKLLDEKGAMTAAEAREALGRELTEAAVMRALGELWQGLRISPVYGEEGEPARWEMMRLRHKDALTTAAGTGQVTALSLLVSMYLESVYAATSEEIEIFLSPAASRSRAREAVRGLTATRQIHSLSMGAQTYYFLKDGLPEFATVAVPEAEVPQTPVAPETPAATRPEPRRQPPANAASGGWQRPQRANGEKFRPRPQSDDTRAAAQEQKPWRAKPTESRPRRDDKGSEQRPGGFRRPGPPPRSGDGESRPAFRPRSGPPRSGGAPPRREGGEGRPTFKPRSGSAKAGGAPPRRESGESRPPFKPRSGPPRAGGAPPRREGGGARPPFKPRSGPPRAGGAPPRREGGGARPPFKPRSGPPRAGGAPPRRESGGGRPPFKPRSGPPRVGGAPPRREGGEGRPPFKPRSGPPRVGGAPPRREGGEGRPPFKPRSGPPRAGGAPPRREGGGGRPPFKPRSGPPRASGAPPRREGGEGRPPFKPRSGPPRAGGAPPRREGGGGRPPFKPRSGPPRASGAPPRREGGQGRPSFRRPGPSGGPRKFDNRAGRRNTPRKKPDE